MSGGGLAALDTSSTGMGDQGASSSNSTSRSMSVGAAEQQTPKQQYRLLKRRFKFLVFENECYQEELRNLQRKLLKLSRDKNFLLDRLLLFEKLSDSSDDSDVCAAKVEEVKKPKRKPRPSASRKKPTPSSLAAPLVPKEEQRSPTATAITTSHPSQSDSNNGSGNGGNNHHQGNNDAGNELSPSANSVPRAIGGGGDLSPSASGVFVAPGGAKS